MKFLVLPEREIEDYNIVEKHVVISITSPGRKHPELPILESRVSLLQLKFYDIDKPFISKGKTYPTFSKKQAKEILNFFNYWKYTISVVVCQCEVGISCSSAVAASLSKVAWQDDSEFFKEYLPNRLVYRLILEEVNKR